MSLAYKNLYYATVYIKIEVLMVGCGNAPFSEEMFQLGYHHQVNIDNCALVIEQQLERAPHIIWEIADVRSMPQYENGRFGVVFDKGLLDNLYCYRDPEENSKKAMIEMYRTLKPGGMFIVLSCHDEEEVKGTLSCDPELKWYDTMIIRLRNPRFPSTRVSFYTMIVCLKSIDGESSSSSFSSIPQGSKLEGSSSRLPAMDSLMNLISPEDNGRICINEDEAQEMKLKTEELNNQSRKAMQERLEVVRQEHAAAQAQFEDAVDDEPPNGSLAAQLSTRRGSLRKVDLPLPPSLSSIMGNDLTQSQMPSSSE